MEAVFFGVWIGTWDSLVLRCAACFASRISSQPSFEVCYLYSELGVCGNQGFVVGCQRYDCSRELLQHDLFCGRGRGKVAEVIFAVVFVDEVVNYGDLWGSCLV